jgi:outer membrane protein assembly factor BamA
MPKRIKPLLYVLCILGIGSCGVEKFIPSGKRLYTGADIRMVSDAVVKDKKALEEELQALLLPEPNTEVLGVRPGLYFYYKAQRKKPGFINRWMNKSIGEKPVYFSDIDPKRAEELILNRLENHGFFYAQATSEIDSTQKYAKVKYGVSLTSPYLLEKYELDSDSLPIYGTIQKIAATSRIKKGNRFDLQLLEAERERIDRSLKEVGYYNFNPDFLIFEADTNRYKDKRFDLYLRLKKNTPPRAIIPYKIDSITVYPNYSISSDSIPIKGVTIDGMHIVQREEFFKPKKLEPYILLKKGQLYNSQTARFTSNRLSAIGSYKFVNTRFTELDTLAVDGAGSLYADIYLTPLTKKALRTEFQAVTKSNGFAGPGITVTHSNRNLFHGGETLKISANFDYETQLSGRNNGGLSSIAAGLKADLIVPRFVPFRSERFVYAVPKTVIGLGVDFLNRTQLYKLNSFNTSYGYTWNENRYVFHELKPINVNYVKLSKTTAEFDTILQQNPFLQRSFEQRFIAGLNYSFTYNELIDVRKKGPIYLNANLDIAGNLIHLLSGGKPNFLGQEYAQYAKLDIDFRHYLKWGKEEAMVSRLFAGWGIPYGNSTTLPYTKQYFSGGPYSVRAFRIRSLGPGSYLSNQTGAGSYYDQSGNVRLEGNLEYRFPIYSYLKGALFVDAGNVWLTGKNTTPDATGVTDELYALGSFSKDWDKELGAGLGFGFRFDIQNFVIRLDLASPFQVPYRPLGERSRIPFFGGGSDNLILNFAIGYPF